MFYTKVARCCRFSQQPPARLSKPVSPHVIDPGDGVILWPQHPLFAFSPLALVVLYEQLVHDGTPNAFLCKHDASLALFDAPPHDFIAKCITVSSKIVLDKGILRIRSRRVWRRTEEKGSKRRKISVGCCEGESLLEVRSDAYN